MMIMMVAATAGTNDDEDNTESKDDVDNEEDNYKTDMSRRYKRLKMQIIAKFMKKAVT